MCTERVCTDLLTVLLREGSEFMNRGHDFIMLKLKIEVFGLKWTLFGPKNTFVSSNIEFELKKYRPS